MPPFSDRCHITRSFIFWAALASGLLAPAFSRGDEPAVVFGVLAYRGEDHAKRVWTPTVDYINAAIPDEHFEILPLDIAGMRRAVRDRAVDFIITNPGNYVELEAEYGISRISTMQSADTVSEGRAIGSVIFTRADHPHIRSLDDLDGRSLMAVSENAFGGFQIAWRELKRHGIDPFEDLSEMRFTGFPMDDIAFAVRDGRADAGIVRTCLLERLEREGRLDLSAFRVLSPRSHQGFRCMSSTALYPDWPVAKTKGTSSDLAKRVVRALLDLAPDSAAARIGGYVGWTVPLDYQPVHDLFRDLSIGPYAGLHEVSLRELIVRYWQWTVFAIAFLLLGVAHTIRAEYLIKARTQDLRSANERLRNEMSDRQRAEEESRRHQAELAHVSRQSIMGELASGLSHEVIQPLGAIVNYARGSERRVQLGGSTKEKLLATMRKMAKEADRAADIIRRIRRFLQKETDERSAQDLNEAIREAVSLFRWEARHKGVELSLDLAENLPWVLADRVQVQQVLLNLLQNGMDAVVVAAPEAPLLTVRTRRTGDGVRVEVSDAGTGLSEEVRRRIFEPFFTTKNGGMGLGLSITRSIVEAHGGTLQAFNNPDGGATFSFVLPLYREGDDTKDVRTDGH